MREEYNSRNQMNQNRNIQSGATQNQMNQNRNMQSGITQNQMNRNRNIQSGVNSNQIPNEKNLPATKKEKNNVFKRIFSLFLAGVVGFGIGLGVGKKDTKELPEEPKTEETGSGELDIVENTSYWDTIKVETPIISETQQEKISDEAIKLLEGVDDIYSSNDALDWFKNFYVSQYKGDKKLDADDISFVQSSNSYIMKAGEQYVTHGSYPDITKNKIINDGLNIEYLNNVDVYSVRIKSTGEVIDCGASIVENAKTKYIQLIPGDSYGEINEADLEFGRLDKIPELVMEMYSLYEENGLGKNGYIGSLIAEKKQELKEAIKGLDEKGLLENSEVKKDSDERENLI